MPVFNEKEWLDKIVAKVLAQQVPGIQDLELIIVDDCSTDGTQDIIKRLTSAYPQKIKPYFQDKNQGKGAALRLAIAKMSGEICIIQDADLEYDPSEYPKILEPILDGRADCVYGSRFMGSESKRVLFFWHCVGNHFLTILSNIFTNINLTDMETCYKAFRSEIIKTIPIRSNRFGFEPEITAKIARRKCRIYEVGISYRGRTYEEGKKITWVDGLKAIFVIVYYGLINDSDTRTL
jgi:glycosyltransferase involved in cell wall biosynthesis